jgi:hypothetical protein
MIAIQRVGSMLLLPAVLSMCLAACGSADEPKPPPPVEETVFRDTVVTPVQKARDVENVVMEQKRAIDQAVDENESAH